MKTNVKRRSLVISALALMLCVAALVGTTFAWFTDTASTAVNRIESGRLDVELWQANADEALPEDALQWVKAVGHEEEPVLWEPGCTYQLESFRIKNNGNLALKYKIEITGIVGDAELLEAIDFSVRVDEPALIAKGDGTGVTTAADLNGFEGRLAPQDATGKITIIGSMKKTAGNAFMKKSIDGIAITVYAAQDTVESDSFDHTYDERATYPTPMNVEDIRAAYGSDGLRMPEGVVITANGGNYNEGDMTITLNDEEAYLYFTQVFNAAEAYEARKTHFADVTKLPGEREDRADQNIWMPASYRHPTVKLGANINLRGTAVQPFTLGLGTTTFDGDGHTIENAKVTVSGDGALFAENMTIRHLTVKNVHVRTENVGGEAKAAIVCFYASGKTENVTVTNSSVIGGKYTGAITAFTYGDTVGCTVADCVISGQYKVGGLVGYICNSGGAYREVAGNVLRNVTVKAENILPNRQAVVGAVIGNWNATTGACKDNICENVTGPAEIIGKIEAGHNVATE